MRRSWLPVLLVLRAAAGWLPSRGPLITPPVRRASSLLNARLSNADEERLLLSVDGLQAFICAEMRVFCAEAMAAYEEEEEWSLAEKMRAEQDLPGDEALDVICEETALAFTRLHNTGTPSGPDVLLSNLGSAISFFRQEFSIERLAGPIERVHLDAYRVAHHVTDMYHHRCFRGTYTKTLAPSGAGEVAARAAVGLPAVAAARSSGEDETEEDVANDDDECLLWSPTGSGECLNWKSEEEGWRKRRFERVQMEGTRDPRRGGSGTTR